MKLDYKKLLIGDSYGINQEWYKTYIKRSSGCGPTTAANIIMYEKRKDDISFSKDDCLKLMNRMWNYITPKTMGINKASMYIKGFSNYIKTHNIYLKKYRHFHIDTNNMDKKELYLFLYNALKKDHPVAFLNLDNGKENNLEAWHWVSIVGIDKDFKTTICDNGDLKKIDLNLWIDTTNSYGDFIYFY